MKNHEYFEGAMLSVLSLLLVGVFAVSVWMYDDIEKNAEEGVLAVFAEEVRDFIDKNEAVSTFFGFDGTETVENSTDTEKKAAAYITRYNGIYESLK